MTNVAFDTETFLISAACTSPPVVCLTWASGDQSGIVHHTEAKAFIEALLRNTSVRLIGHNVAYDFACILQSWPELTPLVWAAYDAGRISDTIVRQKLSDLARGRYRGFRSPSGYFVPLKYDLAAVAHRHLGITLEKDEWRLRYGELFDVPLDQWPAGARDYAILDAVSTLRVYEKQEAESTIFQEGPWFFVNEVAQVQAAWWLHLVSVHGVMTDPAWLDNLEEAAAAEVEALESVLIDAGLVRRTRKRGIDGASRTMAAVRAYIEKVYREQGKEPRLTKGGKDKVQADGTVKKGAPPQICTDSDACLESGDPILEAYVDYASAKKTLNSDCEAYRRGTVYPLHTRFESLAATGRTTSSSQDIKGPDGTKIPIGTNIQNIRWNVAEHCSVASCRSHAIENHKCTVCGAPAQEVLGIRECFVPRPGYVFASADYDGLELRTLAQVCLRTVGHSRLAQLLNSPAPYNDPHLALAATILGISYEEALREKKTDRIKLARQTAKVANFGFPGGLGPDKLVLFARKAYRVRITIEEAKELKQHWLRTFPEFNDYFKFIHKLDRGGDSFTVEHLFTRRLRSGVFFCVAANSFFQGLGADATKAAGYLIVRACYAEPDSPLFGCRVTNYIHDEFHLEVPEAWGVERVNAAARELVRLMVLGAAPFLPDVPATATPHLMRRWSKKAEPWFRKDGLLVPWGDKDGMSEKDYERYKQAA